MESGMTRDSAHSLKLAGGSVIVDAHSLGHSIDTMAHLSAHEASKAARKPGVRAVPGTDRSQSNGFSPPTAALACHRYPRSTQGPIHPKSPGAAVLFEQLQVPGLVLGNHNQGPQLKGSACVRKVGLDPKGSP